MSRKLYLIFLALIMVSLVSSSILSFNHLQANNGKGNGNGNKQKKIDEEFQNFLKKNGKTYSENDYVKRKSAFAQSLKKIEELRMKYPNTKFGITKFADWFPEEKKQLLGFTSPNLSFRSETGTQKVQKNTKSHSRKLQSSSNLGLPQVQIPLSFDWRNEGKVSPIEDQGRCGSCWAFAGIAQLESLLSIHEGINILDLSEQWALQCSDGGSCRGGYYWPVLSYPFLNQQPIKTEEEFSYYGQGRRFPSNKICSNDGGIQFPNKSFNQLAVYVDPSDQLMKKTLIRQGPFAVALNADLFFYYEGGVLDCSSQQTDILNHAVTIVGYDEQGNWIIKNSWGSDFGQNGYITVSKNANCGINYPTQIFFGKSSDLSGQTVPYFVELSSSSQGYGGSKIGFLQDGKIIAQVGEDFVSGSMSGPMQIELFKGYETHIILTQKSTNNIGLVLINESGNVIFSFKAGNYLEQNFVYFSFCAGCD